jgi:hypothetical protein
MNNMKNIENNIIDTLFTIFCFINIEIDKNIIEIDKKIYTNS